MITQRVQRRRQDCLRTFEDFCYGQERKVIARLFGEKVWVSEDGASSDYGLPKLYTERPDLTLKEYRR